MAGVTAGHSLFASISSPARPSDSEQWGILLVEKHCFLQVSITVQMSEHE